MISLKIEDLQPQITLEVRDYIGSGGTGPSSDYYNGEYEVIPKVYEQNLETKGKTMRKDVKVAEIPLHEFSNNFGTTVVIGGIL